MAGRSIASLSLSFGLVSIPVKVYSATESAAAVRFTLLGRGGARLRQQYIADREPASASDAIGDVDEGSDVEGGERTDDEVAEVGREPAGMRQRVDPPTASSATLSVAAASSRPVPFEARRPSARVDGPREVDVEPPVRVPTVVERADMVKGYEFEKGRYVVFTPAELKALAESSRQTIDIVAFVPDGTVDPIYYDKAYFLASDKRGSKPYSLLLNAMRASGRSALAKWAWRAKEYVVQIRAAEGGLVLQQLLYADEVRAIDDLGIELAAVGDAELDLAMKLIDQISVDRYDPTRFVDEEKARILAAVEAKIAGRQIVTHHAEPAQGAQVIDLVEALRASLRKAAGSSASSAAAPAVASPSTARPRRRVAQGAPPALAERKPARRAAKPAFAERKPALERAVAVGAAVPTAGVAGRGRSKSR